MLQYGRTYFMSPNKSYHVIITEFDETILLVGWHELEVDMN